eukprot:Hpha_TRINITY_DN13306_c0_g1::TRINITY_DN13306_c0_g1_i1::g.95339::m.95339
MSQNLLDIGEHVLQEDFPDEMLLELSAQPDLESITALEITFDSEESSVQELGAKLPNLKLLRASSSNLPALRDLGSNLRSLRVLYLNHANVKNCAGISGLPMLEELFLAFNHIDDLSWLAGHPRLRILDVEANCVASMGQVELLAQCTELRSLSLEDNPVAEAEGYRRAVVKAIPGLEFIDDQEAAPFRDAASPTPEQEPAAEAEAEVTPSTPKRATQSEGKVATPARWQDGIEEILKDMRREINTRRLEETAGVTDKMLAAREMRLVTESIRNGATAQPQGRQRSGYTRPGSARGPRQNSGTGWRLPFSARPASASGVRPAAVRPSSFSAGSGPFGGAAADDVSNAVLNRGTKEELLEQLTAPVLPAGSGVLSPERADASASALTHHTSSVFCGNLTRSLRTRRLDDEPSA